MADGHLAWRNNAALPILYILFPPLIARFLSAHFTSFGVVCRLEGGEKKNFALFDSPVKSHVGKNPCQKNIDVVSRRASTQRDTPKYRFRAVPVL